MTPVRVSPGVEFPALAASLAADHDSLSATILEGLLAKHQPGPGEEAIKGLAEHLGGSLREQLRGFRSGELPRSCPAIDSVAIAVLGPSAGLRLLLDGYRFCQATLWRAWFELVEDSLEPGAPERRELLARGSEYFFAYADLLCAYVAEIHQQRAGRPLPSPEERRREAVRELLEGDPLAASWLDFELERHHLGLIAWGDGAREALRSLATDLGRPLLAVDALLPPGGCWGWLSASQPLCPREERALAEFALAKARVAVGLEAFGVRGFRSTHRQAMRALRFAPACGPPLLRFEDVVVESLACENEEDARAFVACELRGISDDSTRSGRLRDTLLAYFAAECNAASAAASLGVHQQTVANRLRDAEQRLGQASIGRRRVELEMALRLRGCLTSDPASELSAPGAALPSQSRPGSLSSPSPHSAPAPAR